VLWGEFDAVTQAHGLHTPGGRVTTTGLGGFTTGGGYGWTSSKSGLACDNLVSAEVVLADGRVVRASEREHAARRSWTRSRRPAGAATRAESTCPGSATPRSTPSSATPPA
jgi:FAD/FMN-containing dehydrogenase